MNEERNRQNVDWLREQLDDLAEHAVLFSTPLEPEEVRTAIHAIRSGRDWRAALRDRRARAISAMRDARRWR